MPEYDNTNRGVMFKNDKREHDKHPNFKGTLDVNGQEFEIAAWERQSKKGPLLSLSVKPKQGRPQQPAEQGRRVSMDDEVPFAPEFR